MMSHVTRLSAALAALLFIGFSLYALVFYTKPLNDQFYDLSMFSNEDGITEWDGDTRGWTVFVQEGETRHGLESLGFGCYNGLDHPGQTVYFSRTMTEKIASPTLRLYTSNRTAVVFLEEEVIYTDCPEQDNRVGYLSLPTTSHDREPVVISLPPDYLGKTLTIVQSNPEIPENPSIQVMLCGVEFYCSYTDESTLIAESFRIAISATLSFVLVTLSLTLLLCQGFRGRWDAGLAMLAVTALFRLLGLLNQASFSYFYFGETAADINAVCRAVSLSALLILLGLRGGRLRWLLWILASLHGCLTLAGRGYAFSQFNTLSELAGCAGLFVSAVLALFWRKEGRRFYRLFAPLYWFLLSLAVAGTAVYGFLVPEWGRTILLQLQLSIQNGIYRFFLWKWTALALVSGTVSAAVEVIRQEIERRTETRLLLQRGILAQENYENLRSQNEAIAALQHDLRHHITVLRSLCQKGDPERVSAYLDTIGAWNTAPGDYTVHPAVNGILTAMLARGERLGIQSKVQVKLPGQLSIPDSDLCALLMNLLENAIDANEKVPEGAERWMKIVIHIRGDYLYIGVENARSRPVDFDPEAGEFRSTKESGIHGYGLKSARAIARKYDSELRLEALDGCFSASTALLLPPPHTQSKSRTAASYMRSGGSFQMLNISIHELLVVTAADRNLVSIVQQDCRSCHPLNMGQIDQITKMAVAESLRRQRFFQTGKRPGKQFLLLHRVYGGLTSCYFQIQDVFQRNPSAAGLKKKALRRTMHEQITVYRSCQPLLVHRFEQILQRIGRKTIQCKTGIIGDIDDLGLHIMIAQKVRQLYTIGIGQLDVQHQDIVGRPVLFQPLRKQRRYMEYINLIIMAAPHPVSVQNT